MSTAVSRPARGGVAELLPGVALSAILMLAGLWIADFAGHRLLSAVGIDPAGKASPVSSVLVAILLGIAVRNSVGLPPACEAGLKFTVTRLLRLGIILVGIKLSVLDVMKLGVMGIPVVVLCVT